MYTTHNCLLIPVGKDQCTNSHGLILYLYLVSSKENKIKGSGVSELGWPLSNRNTISKLEVLVITSLSVKIRLALILENC